MDCVRLEGDGTPSLKRPCKSWMPGSASDPCLFYIGSREDIILIMTYVDDILIASRVKKKISEPSKGFAANFEVKNIRNVKYCLGIKFYQKSGQVTEY